MHSHYCFIFFFIFLPPTPTPLFLLPIFSLILFSSLPLCNFNKNFFLFFQHLFFYFSNLKNWKKNSSNDFSRFSHFFFLFLLPRIKYSYSSLYHTCKIFIFFWFYSYRTMENALWILMMKNTKRFIDNFISSSLSSSF